jgi:hypothetical protein
VPEPDGGAQENPEETARRLRARITAHLDTLAGRDRKALVDARYARYRKMGEFAEVTPTGEPRQEHPRVFDRLRRLLGSGRAAISGSVGALPNAIADGDEPPLQEDI